MQKTFLPWQPAFYFLICFSVIMGVGAVYGKSAKKSAYCDVRGYHCQRVKDGQSWHSLFPNAIDRGIAMRVNHRNGSIWGGMVLKVPDDLDEGDLLEYSPFPRKIDSLNEKVIIFDPAEHAWVAYDAQGDQVRWGPATGGKNWCGDIEQACRTKSGNFRIYSLGTSTCVSRKFPVPDGGAPMPYCMFFNGGQAFHGSPGGVIKDNVSHGCVRMFVDDAEWLRYDFVEPPMGANNYRGTRVVVLPYSTPLPHEDESADDDDNNTGSEDNTANHEY